MQHAAEVRFMLGFRCRRVREKPAGAALIGVGNLKHLDARDMQYNARDICLREVEYILESTKVTHTAAVI